MSRGSVQPKMYLNEKGCYLTVYSCLKKKERLAWYKLITCFKVCGKVHFRFDPITFAEHMHDKVFKAC